MQSIAPCHTNPFFFNGTIIKGTIAVIDVQERRGGLRPKSTGETAVTRAVTKDEAWNLANHWVAAWNAHDLDLIMSHYEDGIELTSPVAAELLGKPDGKVGQGSLENVFPAWAGSLSGPPLSP
jgi:hypothetical protein